jgi:hypothetical protein
VEGGGLRVEGGGLRVEDGGVRFEGGGWRVQEERSFTFAVIPIQFHDIKNFATLFLSCNLSKTVMLSHP